MAYISEKGKLKPEEKPDQVLHPSLAGISL